MEKYIIDKTKLLILVILMASLTYCKETNKISIPQDIVIKSTEYVIKSYKKYLNGKKYILKREFTESVKPFKVGNQKIEIVNEKEISDLNVSTIEFYKFSGNINGDIEVELLLLPRKQYVKLYFTKIETDNWKCTNVEAWQN
ncbi:hypothetical protein [Pedobacter nototheniae]|uniref:hypothetical protein n=1 Tax=Pedobacter nototheniae TaxID=2488994 RepID=UPI00103FA291|nr:hypothetical protein [Pedobacter nototheniae]